MVRAASHQRMGRRRSHRSGQSYTRVSISSSTFSAEWLEVPNEYGSASGVDSTGMDRPATKPAHQSENSSHECPATSIAPMSVALPFGLVGVGVPVIVGQFQVSGGGFVDDDGRPAVE